MELLFSVVGGGLVELGKCICGYVYAKIKNTIKFQSNLDNLKTELENLRNHRNSVKDQLEQAEKNGHLQRAEVMEWLKAVEEIENEVNSILASMEANTGNRLKRCPNCCLGSTLGMEVANILKEVKQLTKAGNFPSGLVVDNYQLRRVEHIPGPSIEDQSTASKNLSRVLSLLNEEDVRRIGVWGMGGVGKTTLVKNLNNMLEKSSTTQPFSIVIWVTVSKNFDLKGVQTQIAQRLDLQEQVSMIVNVGRTATLLYHRLMEEESFLLILDDVWEPIDLDCLGVPQPEQHNSCKVVLTSRNLDVCRRMRTDVEVKVDILSDEESLNLFTRYAGNVVTLSHIQPLAKQITRECHGLPLAIIVVGASMRGKEMIELWKDALNALQRSTPHIPGIEDEVYRPLKWSYDSLQGIDNVHRNGIDIKSCFLYCCLYSEAFSFEVKELVHSWLAEGLIDELQSYEVSYNRGIALVEYLKDSCLLEDGQDLDTVRMHDVVRDVAIWIASFVEVERGFLVQAGIGLTHILVDALSEFLERVSFMDNRITNLPDCAVQCPYVTTLLLQRNLSLKYVSEGFLLGFQALKVLNLSGTSIGTLPLTLVKLSELQALFLRDCHELEKIPSLGGLTKLKLIDFSGTCIKTLPEGMEKLTNLSQLYLSRTQSLTRIRAGIISQLYRLDIIDMTHSAYKWAARVQVGEGEASFEELGCLTQLSVLNIHLDLSCLSLYPPWIISLKKFQFFLGEKMLTSPIETQFDEMRAMLCFHNFNKTWSLHLLNFAISISLAGCEGFEQNPEYFHFTNLKSLHITLTHLFKQKKRGNYVVARYDLLPNLEELALYRVKGINSISYLAGHFGLRLSKLRVIRVLYCDDMNYILSVGGLVVDLESLEEVTIRSCNNVVEIFRCESLSQTSGLALNLKIVRLTCLASLKTLSEPHVSWQRLELFQVVSCKMFKKLPFNAQIANTIKEIRGELEWWDQLEWDEGDTKSTLLQYFTCDWWW